MAIEKLLDGVGVAVRAMSDDTLLERTNALLTISDILPDARKELAEIRAESAAKDQRIEELEGKLELALVAIANLTPDEASYETGTKSIDLGCPYSIGALEQQEDKTDGD